MAPKKFENCALVDHFAIIVQLLLGTIAFSTLIYKRHRERPQRPLLIWFYDVSKQVLGAGIVHGLNIIFSYIAGSINTEDTNPCIWYFLNIFIDCTVGVFILFIILKLMHCILTSAGVKGINSGDYGQPPQFRLWVKQTIAFVCCLILMKIVVIILFKLYPFLFDAAEWILGWTLYDVKLQVVFVMLIFPLIMNIIQFWLVDQVIKKKFETDSMGSKLGRRGVRRRRRHRNHFVIGDEEDGDYYDDDGDDDDDDDDNYSSSRNEDEVFLRADLTDDDYVVDGDDDDDVIVDDGKEINYTTESLPFHHARINNNNNNNNGDNGEEGRIGHKGRNGKVNDNNRNNNNISRESFSMNDIINNKNNKDYIIVDNDSTNSDEIYIPLHKNLSSSSSTTPRKNG